MQKPLHASFPSWTSGVRIPSPALDASRNSRSLYAYSPAVGDAARRSLQGGSTTTFRPIRVVPGRRDRARPPPTAATGPPASREEYDRRVAEWLAAGRSLDASRGRTVGQGHRTIGAG